MNLFERHVVAVVDPRLVGAAAGDVQKLAEVAVGAHVGGEDAPLFAPGAGVPEDPATGSAAGCIGSYVVKNRAVPRASLTRIIVEQGIEMGRPARLYVEVHSDGDRICSVLVGGSAVIVGEGSLYDPPPA